MNRNKEFFKYVIPTIISFTLTGIYSIVDGFFVGNSIGDVGLSSINIAYPISALIQSFGIGIGMGGSVRYSIEKAEKNNGDVRPPRQVPEDARRTSGGSVFRPGPNPEPGPAALPEERSSLSNKPLQNPASSIAPILLSCP